MTTSRLIGGCAALTVSAALYLATRAWLLTVWDRQDLQISASLSIGVVLMALALAAGLTSTWLLLRRRAARVILAIAYAALCLPTLVGCVLTVWDYLSASGFNGFGAVILILAGNSLLLVAAGLAAATGIVTAGLLIRQRRTGHRAGSSVGAGDGEPMR